MKKKEMENKKRTLFKRREISIEKEQENRDT